MAIDTNNLSTTHREAFEIENLQFQVGAFLMPQYLIRSHAECYYSLKQSLGIAANSLHGIDIDGNACRNDKFTVGIDSGNLLGLSFTGMNTKHSLMTVKFKTAQANQAHRMHSLLFTEQILEINDTGVSIYD